MVDLATAAIGLADALDAARHELPRGEDVQEALVGLEERITGAVDAARAATAASSEAPVSEAADIVRQAAEAARTASDAATAERAFLVDVATIDVALNRAAAAWDEPGSQSEVRDRLGALARDLAAQRGAVRSLRPVPAGCTTLVDNRSEWVRTVRERTLQLREQAHSGGGSRYDDLRAAFRRLPLGEEPRTADRADRDCWERESDVATAAAAVRQAVEDLEAALSG